MNRLTKLVIFLVLVLIAWVTSGCSLVLPQTDTPERVWLAIDALDTAQTVTIARSPTCLREASPLAAAIYGSDHPSPRRVVATNVLLAYTHAQISAWLDRHTVAAALDESDDAYASWQLARTAFRGLSLGGSGFAVLKNSFGRVGPFTRVDKCNP